MTETQATVSATIEPHGHATSYEVWLIYSPCAPFSECPKALIKQRIGQGKLRSKTASGVVGKTIKMLSPGCDYAYWFVASNSAGRVESEQHVIATEGTTRPRE